MLERAATYQKTHPVIWRNRLVALGLILFSIRLIRIAFHIEGHETLCLFIQTAAFGVLLAAAGLSFYLLCKPTLKIDKVGISESGFLLKQMDWSMNWSDISHAEIGGKLYKRVALIGMESGEAEHVLHGYESLDTAIEEIKAGLWKYGRRITQSASMLPSIPK